MAPKSNDDIVILLRKSGPIASREARAIPELISYTTAGSADGIIRPDPALAADMESLLAARIAAIGADQACTAETLIGSAEEIEASSLTRSQLAARGRVCRLAEAKDGALAGLLQTKAST